MQKRIAYLDSARGIAAFSVLIYHFIFSLDLFHYWDGRNTQHYLSCIFNGSDAVSFFFVLSGLVLSLRYFNPESKVKVALNYRQFIVQRVFRIYPAYIIMLFMSFLFMHKGDLSFSFLREAIFNRNYDFLLEAGLIRNFQALYTPGWTLSVEIIFSLIVPVFVVLLIKTPNTYLLLLPLSILISAFISSFAFHFMLGVWLGKNYEAIQSYDFKKSKWYPWRYLIYLLVFLMFSLRHIDRIQSFNLFYYYPNHYLGLDFFHITGFASFLILWKLINDQTWQRVLNWSPFIFLGKISYSLYLTHWFVIFYLFTPRPNRIAQWLHMEQHAYYAGLIFCVLTTLGMSAVFYYLFEKPFNNWGKLLSKRLNTQASTDYL